jgi:Flp pilus assembly pilin Flp
MVRSSSLLPRRHTARHPVGQSLTEYMVIVFLLAVGTIGVVGLFGDNLRHLFGSSAETLAGSEDAKNGGKEDASKLTKWSMKGRGSGAGTQGGGPGGSSNSTDPGNGGGPGGTANMPGTAGTSNAGE